MVADDVDVVAGAAAVGLVCDHHVRSDHGDRRASRAGGKHGARHARGPAAVAFDLIEHDGDDPRDLPLIDRKRRLARLIGRAKHGVKEAALPGSFPDRNG